MINIYSLWNSVKINNHVYVDIGESKAIYLKQNYEDCFIIEGTAIDIFNHIRKKKV
jgi:hypothetical protein